MVLLPNETQVQLSLPLGILIYLTLLLLSKWKSFACSYTNFRMGGSAKGVGRPLGLSFFFCLMFIVLAAFEPGGCFYWLFVALRDAWWHLLGQKNGLLPPPPAATSLVHKPSATPRHAFRENINFYHMLIQETNSCVCRFEEVSFFAMAGI